MNVVSELTNVVLKGYPIDGISGGNPATCRVQFKPEATEEQRAEVMDIVRSFSVEKYKQAEKAKQELLDIDLKSIRSIREYIASQPNAPKEIKDREALAAVARSKIKG
jgi:hypothetical protein